MARTRCRLGSGVQSALLILIFGFILGMASPSAQARTVTATVPVGTNPPGVAVNSVTNQVYVANYSSSDVTVIDGATNSTTTVAAGTNPYAVAVNSVTNQVYVANYTSNNVTVIDGATNSTTTVSAGTNPYAVAVNSVTNNVYVANVSSNNVTVIQGATNATTTIAVGAYIGFPFPIAISVNPVTNNVYVASDTSSNVTVIDGATNRTTTVAAGTDPYAVAVNSVTNQVYFANYSSNNVTVIDGATNRTTTVLAGAGPAAVAVNSVTNQVYVANYNSNDVTVIDGATNRTTTRVVPSANPSTSGSSVTFTATVATSGSQAPTGTVTFLDGSTSLGAGTLNGSAVATFATSSFVVGQNFITAAYSGDPNNSSSSGVLTQTVTATAMDFTLAPSPTSKTVTAGQPGTFMLTVTPQGSFTNPISFSCTGLPTLAGCTFNPSSLIPNASTVTTTMTISTSAYTAAYAAHGEGVTPAPLGHHPNPLYAIWLVLPAMLLGTAGIAAPNRRRFLAGCLVLSLIGGCLLQVACVGASNGGSERRGGGAGGTPAGTYTVTVTGAAGSTRHTTTVTLTVQQELD